MNKVMKDLYHIQYGRVWFDLIKYFDNRYWVNPVDQPTEDFINKYRTFELKHRNG